MKRRTFVKAFPFIGAAVAMPVAAAQFEDSDDHLLKLVEEWRQVSAAEAEAWAEAEPLSEAAREEFIKTGLSFDGNWEKFMALHKAMGASAAEEKASAIAKREGELVYAIRSIHPKTCAGVLAKFEVLRTLLQISDDEPRVDQDWDHEFFNVFGDDLSAFGKVTF